MTKSEINDLAKWVEDDVMGRLDTADWTGRERRICELAVRATIDRVTVTNVFLGKGDGY